MILPTLVKAYLVKRYKRFLVDVILDETKELITAHCPNSGSMLSLLHEGYPVYLSKSTNPKNKLSHKLELIELPNGTLVGVNTSLTNYLVKEALENKKILELSSYDTIKMEQTFNDSRFDFFLQETENNNIINSAFLEVKSVTLSQAPQVVSFPDAVTARGSKHLLSLKQSLDVNSNAYLIYVIQRSDATEFHIAKEIDKAYYENALICKKYGVKFLCYSCAVSLQEITINQPIKMQL